MVEEEFEKGRREGSWVLAEEEEEEVIEEAEEVAMMLWLPLFSQDETEYLQGC